ncbi:chemotaxis protein CheW [Kineosporia succinea]|uniref:Chemotaxis signal transduction protein n=1 Tax=Kineosporia succinea TaxID=84632 RepID=A0ABT9P540_9ACTN|nr:chemotaxis protein CheW [Kineosporia succinea]MDP9827793.1 chemotaxis signal transduction protein [Kineosporia succinea]
MSPHRTGLAELAGRAPAMRAEFDTSFAEVPAAVVLDLEDVLAIRLGDEERLITLDEVARVTSRPAITALPTFHPAMIGVVSDRGSLAAVWDLALLLGLPAQSPDWLVVPSAEPGLAITFEHFAGFRRVESARIGDEERLRLADLVRLVRDRAGAQNEGDPR